MREWSLGGATHLSRSADHLGSLANVLKDLGGPATIIHELTQNADDGEGATTVHFKVDAASLTVWNDGEFTNCDDQTRQTCPWKESGGRACDLHSFRVFSGRHKRDDASTTGAFGVGFTCVYHVTDHPELVTAGAHLVINEGAPESQRIRVCRETACGRDHDAPGTTFILPWAREASPLREELQVQPVSDGQIDKIERAFLEEASSTVLFLRRVSRIDVETRSEQRTVIREIAGDILRIRNGLETQQWLVLEGEYDSSEQLRRRFPDIEDNRSRLVQVAIRIGSGTVGRFYAGLPSQMLTGWNAHVNGSFYPRTDRKGFEFSDGTFRSEWNLDLLDSAAHIVGGSLERVAELTGVTSTWTMLRDLERLDRDARDGKLPEGFKDFFAVVAKAAANAAILQLADGQVRIPAGTVVPIDSGQYGGERVLQRLGLPIVAESLRSLVLETSYTRYGISQLTAGRLIEHLLALNAWTDPWHADESPLSEEDLDALLALIEALLDRSKSWISEPRTALLAVIPCAGSWHASAQDAVKISDPSLNELFTKLDPTLLVVDDDRTPMHSPALLGLVPELDVPMALEVLTGTKSSSLLTSFADQLIDWFEQHLPDIEQTDWAPAALRSLPLFPTSTGERDSLERLSIPSDFEDSFGIASLIDAGFAQHHWSLLETIGAQKMTAVEYLSKQVIPRLGEIEVQDLEYVLDLVYDARRAVEDEPAVVDLLRSAPLVPCLDGVARPASAVHMPSPAVSLIDPSAPIAAASDLASHLHEIVVWLGASERPSHELVNDAARRLADGPDDPDPAVCEAILQAIGDVSKGSSPVPSDLANLRDRCWLPADGGGSGSPAELFPVFRSYLFESQGPKLGLARSVQNTHAETLSWLGMPKEPTLRMVVAHLRHCAAQGRPMNDEVYVWLGNHATDRSISGLAEEPCIQIGEGRFVHPKQVHWQPTMLGRWAAQLPHEMRRFQDFLDVVGVVETPGAEEIDFILHRIGHEVGTSPLEPEDELVVHECWVILDTLLNDDPAGTERVLRVIGRRPSFPDPRGVLAAPERLLFRDPRGLVDKIELLAHEVIDRERRTQHALERAGVVRAENVIEVEPVDVTSTADTETMRLVNERRVALVRAVESVSVSKPEAHIEADRLFELDIHRADRLSVVYRASVGSQVFATEPEMIDAIYLPDHGRVVHMTSQNRIPVARELSSALAPDLDPSELAPLMITVLDASSADDAMLRLDDYGVPRLIEVEREGIPSAIAADPTLDRQDADDEIIAQLGPGVGQVSLPSVTGIGTVPIGPAANFSDAQEVGGGDQTRNDGDAPPCALGTSREVDEVAPGDGTSRRRRQRNGERQPRRRPQQATRMRSYVSFGEESTRGTVGDEAPRSSAVDRAGVDRVLTYEREHGRIPEEQDHWNPGFDVLSRDRDDQVLRRIEVKSISGDWTVLGVMLSSRQFEEATQYTDQFWLYVVENAEDDDLFRIYRIQDPARHIDYFGFDHGWVAISEPDA